MANIELVIQIDEKTYKDIKKGKVYSSMRDVPQESVLAIANGIPLPKGHGRLIDADKRTLDYDWSEYETDDGQLIVNGYQAYSEFQIDEADTVLEADRQKTHGNPV